MIKSVVEFENISQELQWFFRVIVQKIKAPDIWEQHLSKKSSVHNTAIGGANEVFYKACPVSSTSDKNCSKSPIKIQAPVEVLRILAMVK